MVTDKGMIIVTDRIKTRWAGNTRPYYEGRGYEFTSLGDEFEVFVGDLTDNSAALVSAACPVCGKTKTASYQKIRNWRCCIAATINAQDIVESGNRLVDGSGKRGLTRTRNRPEPKEDTTPRVKFDISMEIVQPGFKMSFSVSYDSTKQDDDDNDRTGNVTYRGPNWETQSEMARERDGFACVRCSKSEEQSGRKMDVHHIVPFREFGYIARKNTNYIQANDLSNLATLCKKCHGKAEKNSAINDELMALRSLRQ